MSFVLYRKDLNVGQGGFTALKAKNSLTKKKVFSIVYDCGSSTSRKKVNESDIMESFEEFNEDKNVDVLVLSHLDVDHVNMTFNLFSSFEVKKIVLPYLPNETVLCFLNSISKSRYFDSLKWLCRRFYLERESFEDGAEVFYNISASADEEAQGVLTEEGVERAEESIVTFIYRGNIVDQGSFKTKSLEKIIVKRQGQAVTPELVIVFFQPHYSEKDLDALRNQANLYIHSSCNSYEEYKTKMGSLKKHYKGVHKVLNETSVGMFVSLYNSFEQHLLTGDMTINGYAIKFFLEKLYFDSAGFSLPRKFTSNMNFQLPHHGSKHSIDVSCPSCLFLLEKFNVTVMHGKNRVHHPSSAVTEKTKKITYVTE